MASAAKSDAVEPGGNRWRGATPPPGADSHGAHGTAMSGVGSPSRHAAARCLSDVRPALESIRAGRQPDLEFLAWPAGLDRSVLRSLPLAVRTRNCLAAGGLMEGDSPLKVGKLLRVTNFGWRSLTDLMQTTEDFLTRCAGREETLPPVTHRADGSAPGAGADSPPSAWERAAAVLGELLAAAAELHGAETLADGLGERTMRLAGKMGIADELGSIGIDELADGAPGLVSASLGALERFVAGATETERRIVEERLLRTPPRTLEEVGTESGVTRERIRQIQVRLERRIGSALGAELPVVASTLKEELGHVVAGRELEARIGKLLANRQRIAGKLFEGALVDRMGFTLDHGMYLDETARRELGEIRSATRRLADDVGLVDAERVAESFPSPAWTRWWPWVRERCGLVEVFGSLGLRDSGKARAKAALISIGRPATREEIAGMCGFTTAKAGSHLSAIPSVVKADKDRWGLGEWVDDEYDGIVGEIVQRIEEEGGATTTERLLTELPEKFGVNPVSVRAYLQTPKFVVGDGWVSLASSSSVQLRSLDDVVDGRDPDGAPYWTFAVEARFFDGYSLTGVPPEFAHALGCEPDAGADVRIENLRECRPLSLRWRLASTTGASLGYLAEPLRKLGMAAGDRARVTVKGAGTAALTVDDGNPEEPGASEANAILERLMQRRRVL